MREPLLDLSFKDEQQAVAKNPMVSVMMPVFNGDRTVARALASLLVQTEDRWEAIVVDDGSTDCTAEVVNGVDDPRVRLFRFDSNLGRGRARQFALERCRGELLAMLDADDWWFPWKLERQLEFMRLHPEVGVVSSSMLCMGLDGNLRGIVHAGCATGEDRVFPPVRNLFSISIPHAPSMIRRIVVEDASYDPELRRAEDFHFLAQILFRTAHAILFEPLYVYADELSYAKDAEAPRYLWSARASLRLTRQFPVSSVLKAVCDYSLAVGSYAGVCPRPALQQVGPDATGDFERAKNILQDSSTV
jgi:glycosyltransferase involved in cell wall biosynthesis